MYMNKKSLMRKNETKKKFIKSWKKEQEAFCKGFNVV